MSAAKTSIDEAYALLGLERGAAPAEATAAFRAAAKRAHPDRPGGDAERFRQILAAYRLVQSVPRLPATIATRAWPEVAAIVSIDPLTALRGGEAQVRLSGERVVRLHIPAGEREGDRLTFQG
ncbi:MAG: DnaJ domain-containing protein, partial [Caulobacteraceae bacterium]